MRGFQCRTALIVVPDISGISTSHLPLIGSLPVCGINLHKESQSSGPCEIVSFSGGCKQRSLSLMLQALGILTLRTCGCGAGCLDIGKMSASNAALSKWISLWWRMRSCSSARLGKRSHLSFTILRWASGTFIKADNCHLALSHLNKSTVDH